MQKYLELGISRTMKQVQEVMKLLSPEAPSLSSLKRWSVEDKWADKAAEYDLQQITKFNSLPASPATVEAKAVETFHAKVALAHMAESFAKRVTEWCDGDQTATTHIRSATDARILADCAVRLVGQVEVLEGRVSDRKAAEATITQAELKQQADSRAADMLSRMAIAVKKNGLDAIDTVTLN